MCRLTRFVQISSMSKGTSGTSTAAAPPAMPAYVAIHPAWRPITSHTITRSWDSAVVCSRSMASTQICTAVLNPNVTSVADRSLSIVFGAPTTLTPSSQSLLATPRVSSPPMAINASTPRSCNVCLHRSGPLSTLYGLVRELPRMVPPRGRMPRHTSTLSGVVRPSITPRHPSRKPTNRSSYCTSPLRTAALMTAFSPGQSPPPVRIPTRMDAPYRWSGAGLRRSRFGQQAGVPRLPGEVVCLDEALVDAGEPEVRHLVEGAEAVEDGQPDLLRRDLGAGEAHLLLHLQGDVVELRVGEGTVLGRGPQAGDDLRPVPRLPVPRALHDQQRRVLDPLVGGEAAAAPQALPAPADGRPVIGEPRVHDLVIEGRAHGVAHAATVPSAPVRAAPAPGPPATAGRVPRGRARPPTGEGRRWGRGGGRCPRGCRRAGPPRRGRQPGRCGRHRER